MESETFIRYLTYFIVIFFLLAISLQVIYLHFKIRTTQDMVLNKSYKANSAATNVAHDENRLKIYSCLIKLKIITRIFQDADDLKPLIQPALSRIKSYIPLSCDREVKNVQVTYNKIGVLVLYKNEGSSDIYDNISTQKIHYLIINKRVYGVEINEEMKNILLKFYKNDNEIMNELKNNIILFLLPLKNFDLKPNAIKEDEYCRYDLSPFIGDCPTRTNNEIFIDLQNEVVYNLDMLGVNQLPIQIIGYRTL